MSRAEWLRHLAEVSGLTPPSLGGDRAAWIEFRTRHHAGCAMCKARVVTRRRATYARERRQALKDLGLHVLPGGGWE